MWSFPLRSNKGYESICMLKNYVIEERNPYALLVEIYIGSTTIDIRMEFPQEKYIEQPYHPTISLLGIYPKEMKSPS